jgi:hypothetical protein
MRQTHPLYKKQYTRHRKFMAHDEQNQARIGDLVAIQESRPVSARKRFVLDKIIERAGAGFEEKDAAADVPMEELEKKQPPKTTAKPKTETDTKEPTKKTTSRLTTKKKLSDSETKEGKQ